MKKQIFSILAVAAALVLSLSSCSNDDPASALEINLERTATIEGTILVNADITKAIADQKWSAPDNVIVEATVDYQELNNSISSGSYRVTGTYNKATGKFSVQIPVGIGATNVTVMAYEFKGTLKKSVGIGADEKTINVIWGKFEESVSVNPGEVVYKDWKRDGIIDADWKEIKEDGSLVN